MSLREFVQDLLPGDEGFDFRLPDSRRYETLLIASAGRTESPLDPGALPRLLATIFWDMVTGTPEFHQLLYRKELPPRQPHDALMAVVPHGAVDNPRYSLVVLLRGLTPGDERTTAFVANPDQLYTAWRPWYDRRIYRLRELESQGYYDIVAFNRELDLMNVGVHLISDMVRLSADNPPRVVIGEFPPAEYTSVPRGEWGAGPSGCPPTSTVGVIARRRGRKELCVTMCNHDLPSGAVMGAQIDLCAAYGTTQSGTLIRRHQITDSAIVSLVNPKDPAFRRDTTSGPLRNTPPVQWAPATFHGLVSRKMQTQVEAWDTSIMFFDPLIQSKMYTPPDTRAGDSGAALVDNKTNYELGLAMYTTGTKPRARHAGWVWADSVYRVHKLVPI